jgi:peptidoglycan/LPS O-acetylase OafA/YrhL
MMLSWIGFGVLLTFLAIRLRWKKMPGAFTTTGVLLGAHLIAADVVPPDRRPFFYAMTFFLTGLLLMCLVILLARLSLRPTPPTEPPR